MAKNKKNNKKNVKNINFDFSTKYLDSLTFNIDACNSKGIINIPFGINNDIADLLDKYDGSISWENHTVYLRIYHIHPDYLPDIAYDYDMFDMVKLVYFICRSIDTYNQVKDSKDNLINQLMICPRESNAVSIPVERDVTIDRVSELMAVMSAYYTRNFCKYTMQDIAKTLLKRRTKIYQDYAFNKDDFQNILKEINLVLTNDAYYRKTLYETINKYTAAIMGCSMADAIKDDDELKTYISNDAVEIIIDKPVQLILKPQNLGNYTDSLTHTFNYIKRKISECLATDITEE